MPDAIKRLAQEAWRFHPNNKQRVRCPKCDGGDCFPASGRITAEMSMKEAIGCGPDGGKVKAPGAIKCKACNHIFTTADA